MNNKIIFTKKMIGKRVAVIDDYEKNFFFSFGVVESIKDQDTLVVKDDSDVKKEVSIFDIRNPAQEIL